ncbi:hypothetical protein VFPPC_17079 [Pochonia chlamydosporia 170]|uniref:Uncharacterized protein n=1 Tax=Pochonia chlamydosporia 170 TaxID=1380566 RepID=A0A179EY59_METCM|nr:hypothetical protein VFPPC_17079 [Pochonia chlamydosporia 170]OAQ57839.1 hypothetical protein VFPPC_17079 [Pochonia chlamydosporia 170]
MLEIANRKPDELGVGGMWCDGAATPLQTASRSVGRWEDITSIPYMTASFNFSQRKWWVSNSPAMGCINHRPPDGQIPMCATDTWLEHCWTEASQRDIHPLLEAALLHYGTTDSSPSMGCISRTLSQRRVSEPVLKDHHGTDASRHDHDHGKLVYHSFCVYLPEPSDLAASGCQVTTSRGGGAGAYNKQHSQMGFSSRLLHRQHVLTDRTGRKSWYRICDAVRTAYGFGCLLFNSPLHHRPALPPSVSLIRGQQAICRCLLSLSEAAILYL